MAFRSSLSAKMLDKSKFVEMQLPGDNVSTSNSRPLPNIWDENTDIIWHSEAPYLPGIPFPHYVSIDLGIEAIVSHFKIWSRSGYYYSNHSWKTFEIWGATSYRTDQDEAYWTGEAWKSDGWVKLADCEIRRPSGETEPIGNPTGEDLAVAQAGFDFEAPGISIRYLRFIIKSTWASDTGNTDYAMHMAEISVYGK